MLSAAVATTLVLGPALPALARTPASGPAAGPELSTTDLDPAWAASYLSGAREPTRPLSAASLVVFVF